MDVSVWVLVIAVVAALVSAALTWGLLRRSKAMQVTADRQRQLVVELETERDAALSEAERERCIANKQRAETASATEEITQLSEELKAVQADCERIDIAASTRELEGFRRRLRDVSGLESEVATLRVIAARVPELEARLAQLEGPERSIDLRER